MKRQQIELFAETCEDRIENRFKTFTNTRKPMNYVNTSIYWKK